MLRLGASLPTSVPVGSSLPNLLLDDYDGGVRAYSVRKLKKGYGSYVIRVRRSSDDEEADVAFDDDGELTTDSKVYNSSGSTLDGTNFNTWAGTTAYVTVWYDQSGGGFHLSQDTASVQPVIKSVSLLAVNGKTALSFTSDFLPIDSSNLNIGSISVYSVVKSDNLSYGTNQWPWGLSTDASEWFGLLLNGNVDRFYYGSVGLVSSVSANTSQMLSQFSAGASDAPKMYRDGSAGTGSGTRETDACTVNSLNGLGGWGTSLYPWDGSYQEFIVFNNDTYSDRAAITSNINSFYSVY
jgi:hypothetical protein